MALGAYSIVRYSDHLSDQRVNLGVLVWHPLDGFAFRFSPSLDRIQAIDPRIRLTSIREQLQLVEKEILKNGTAGKEKLNELSSWYKEGLEVTSPYPAQIQSIDEMLEHLYQMLVSPVPEIRRASTQRQFEVAFKKELSEVLKTLPGQSKLREIGSRRINGVSVNVGLQTITHQHKALWRALSLQAQDHPEMQVAKAKATALDINLVRAMSDFKGHAYFVALQQPKPRALERFDESVTWLKHEADDVMIVRTRESLAASIAQHIRALD